MFSHKRRKLWFSSSLWVYPCKYVISTANHQLNVCQEQAFTWSPWHQSEAMAGGATSTMSRLSARWAPYTSVTHCSAARAASRPYLHTYANVRTYTNISTTFHTIVFTQLCNYTVLGKKKKNTHTYKWTMKPMPTFELWVRSWHPSPLAPPPSSRTSERILLPVCLHSAQVPLSTFWKEMKVSLWMHKNKTRRKREMSTILSSLQKYTKKCNDDNKQKGSQITLSHVEVNIISYLMTFNFVILLY